MKDLLSKLYDQVANEESKDTQFDKECDCRIDEALKPLRERMTESEIDDVKALVYAASYYQAKSGFVLGVRFIVRLLMESLL